jgi:hypothetical protein
LESTVSKGEKKRSFFPADKRRKRKWRGERVKLALLTKKK